MDMLQLVLFLDYAVHGNKK